jgi:hypothetical protein
MEAGNTVLADRLVVWMPRLLGIALALFLATFAFDAFSDSGAPFDKTVAFLIHLIPAGLVGLAVAVAWRRELIGAVACAALGAGYILFAWNKFPLSVYVAIAGPLFLTALLFVGSWRRTHRRVTR